MTNPMPTEEALHEFYTNRYRLFYRKFEHPSPELMERLGIAKRARHSAKFLQEAGVLRKGTKVLDLGCADGSLLRATSEIEGTVETFGVEPNLAYAEYASQNGVDRIWPALGDVPAEEKFDLVIVNHVLEHVRDPVGLLAELRARLSPAGAIYVDVPDAARYASLSDLHIAHIYHFTLETLRQIAGRAGLHARMIARHEPPQHPLSVRALFVSTAAPMPGVRADAEAALVRAAIRSLARKAPLYFARRSLIGRIVVGIPQRMWRTVAS
jgi:2-polyprenyl-3-methyl-5-hydroxy-6-metoxy-1,4-benzoquinol methylase